MNMQSMTWETLALGYKPMTSVVARREFQGPFVGGAGDGERLKCMAGSLHQK